MTARTEHKTRADGTLIYHTEDLKGALERAYKVAETMPLDPDYLPVVSVFDEHGFVTKIDRVAIEKRRLEDAGKTPAKVS